MKLGFCEILAIVFIILKLCGVINWSWVWVLSPIWIVLLLIVVAAAWKAHREKKQWKDLTDKVKRWSKNED